MQGAKPLFSGSGSPEGQVTASAGAFYLDASTGTFYHKGQGNDSTGWSALNLVGNLTGNSSTATLATLSSGSKDTVTVALVDGAIAVKTGTVVITKGSAAALTLAAPTVTTDDGKVLSIVGTTTFAHTVTTPSNIVNGGKHLITYAAAGDSVELTAYQGVWYSRALNGAVIS
jgi:hypothetical protein